MSLVERERVGGQVLGGETLQQCGGHRLEVETVRNRHRPIRWDHMPFRIGTADVCPADPVAGAEPSHTVAKRDHSAGSFHARDEGEGDVIETAAVVHVDIVDSAALPRPIDPRAGLGLGQIIEHQILGAAQRSDGYRFHGCSTVHPRFRSSVPATRR